MLYNKLNNAWELKVAYQQNFPVGKSSNSFYSQSAFIEFRCYCMVRKEELKWEDHIWSFDNIKNLLWHHSMT